MLRSEGGRGDRRRRRRAERGGTGTPPGWCQPPLGLQRAPRTLGTRSVNTMGWPGHLGTPPGTTSSSSSSTPSPKSNLSSLKEEFLRNLHKGFSFSSFYPPCQNLQQKIYIEEHQRRTRPVSMVAVKNGGRSSSSSSTSSFEHLESS